RDRRKATSDPCPAVTHEDADRVAVAAGGARPDVSAVRDPAGEEADAGGAGVGVEPDPADQDAVGAAALRPGDDRAGVGDRAQEGRDDGEMGMGAGGRINTAHEDAERIAAGGRCVDGPAVADAAREEGDYAVAFVPRIPGKADADAVGVAGVR